MDILAHRGWWIASEERNTLKSFFFAWSSGFGIETDVRDAYGSLFISHDPVDPDHALSFEEFLFYAQKNGSDFPLALNVKADGLALSIKEHLKGKQLDWFVFDMSFPDMMQHLDAGNPVFARMSEYEAYPEALEGRIHGVWLDAFHSIFYDESLIRTLRDKGLRVALVSPELHRLADQKVLWDILCRFKDDPGVLLCTDYPRRALEHIKGVSK